MLTMCRRSIKTALISDVNLPVKNHFTSVVQIAVESEQLDSFNKTVC